MIELKTKIKKIMEEIFEENITDDFDKFKAKNWDSFMHLDLVVKLEEEFGISFSPEEIGMMNSLDNILNVITCKLENSNEI